MKLARLGPAGHEVPVNIGVSLLDRYVHDTFNGYQRFFD
jgi:hypothetical protein